MSGPTVCPKCQTDLTGSINPGVGATCPGCGASFRFVMPPRPKGSIRPQVCSNCEYDLTGLGKRGRLVKCPECGADNRIGEVAYNLMHKPLPVWWVLAPKLGWPAAPVAFLAYLASWSGSSGVYFKTLMLLSVFIAIIGISRALMTGIDSSTPARRYGTVAWTVVMAIVGHALLAGTMVMCCWGLVQLGKFLIK